MILKYENLRADGPTQLRKLLGFLGQSPTDADIEDAVNYASLDNLRRLERENSGKLMFNTRLKPADANDPSSFKVRRGKVGGWRDYLTPEQAEKIDHLVETELEPVFGYGTAQKGSASQATG
jgi:hypothetical protein